MRDFDKIISFAKERKIAVEIGGIRNLSLEYEIGDGHSTKHWIKYFEEVYSVDIDKRATELTMQATNNPKNLFCITEDGISFLKRFNKKIDLLYLDGWDVIAGTDYMEKHLEAFKSAEDKLHKNSIIVIDDMEDENNGKGALVLPYALNKGWKYDKVGKQIVLFMHD